MKTKLKNGFKKVRKWIKKHKVLTVFLILAAVVIGIYFRLQRAGQEMAEALSQMAFETGEVSYRISPARSMPPDMSAAITAVP